MKIINMDVGKSVRVCMATHDISNKKLAEDFQVTDVYVSAYLRRNKGCGWETIQRLANYFNLAPSEFLKIGETVESEE